MLVHLKTLSGLFSNMDTIANYWRLHF
jgi:hypothetical protein